MKHHTTTGLIVAAITFASQATAQTEVIFLADCYRYDATQTPLIQQSLMLYYPDESKTHNNEIPELNNVGRFDQTGLVKWEVWQDLEDNSQEQFVKAAFSTGNHVRAYINADAGSWNTFDACGNAVNDNGKWFTCRKDNGRTIYNVPKGANMEVCNSRYYCEV
ncbi:hypothetical protein HDU97_003762 [Phlyctochytrium planicorne]|nr:hypothetical protein HDU97_003762 [Phlyctochytrium planicorne]